MAQIEQQLARLATRSPAELREEWRRAHGKPAPKLSADLLRFGIAYRLQEKAFGALPPKLARQLMRAGKEPAMPPVKPGTRLVRTWNGRTITVEATDAGFSFENRTYTSLSAIAREVTGAHWSGPRFFGVAGNG